MTKQLACHVEREREEVDLPSVGTTGFTLYLLVSYGRGLWTVPTWRNRTFLIQEESGIMYFEEIKLAIGSHLHLKAIR